jgi:hypothetical protein
MAGDERRLCTLIIMPILQARQKAPYIEKAPAGWRFYYLDNNGHRSG